ncbi:MAG: hypothetical protein GY953_08865, partial [bacterium]|nr:hypothetical protein [bacterium]
RLEASRANADMSRARITYQRAEQSWLRSQTLIRAGATPRREHERVEADYQAKRQEYESLQKVADAANGQIETLVNQMEKARQSAEEAREDFDLITSELMAADVIASVDGVLSGMSAQQGDEVHPEAGDLFQIAVELSRLEVVAEPGPAVTDRILPGQPARVYLAEIPGEWVSGEVREVLDGRVVVEFISPTAAVVPGLTAQVAIQSAGNSTGR